MIKTSVLLALFYVSCHLAHADTAIIATASNFKTTLTKLIDLFHDRYPHQLTIVAASSGVLFNQIKHGAPFDVFLSADSLRPTLLENEGLGVKDSRFTYAEGRLALAFNHKAAINIDALSDNKINVINTLAQITGKIAIANPKIAPYGIAAEQSLRYLFIDQKNAYKTIEQRLVLGTNINQCFQYVSTGNAAIAYVALTQLLSAESKLRYWVIPKHWHHTIEQQAILLQTGKNNQAAKHFMHFLSGATAKHVILHHGYDFPAEPPIN